MREGAKRNKVAAYVASQIGQTAQVRADHGMSHRVARYAAVRQSGPPPEGARVRMKKGLHLAMKAFYFMAPRAFVARGVGRDAYFAFDFGSVTKPSFVRPPACAADITSATRS